MRARERRDLAVRLAGIAAEQGFALSISADVELAAAVGAAGVHLQAAGQVAAARDRLPDAMIGVSAHSLADVAAAAAAGADYVTLSPIFVTDSKPGYGPALGTESLRAPPRSASRCWRSPASPQQRAGALPPARAASP